MDTYKLTPDEFGMLQTIQGQIEALQKETQIVLYAIMKYRNINNGQWDLQGDTLVLKETK